MTALLERDAAQPQASPPAPARPRRFDPLPTAVTATLATACVPLGRVFLGFGWIRLVLAALLLPIGIAWLCRRVGLRPAGAFAASLAGWIVFTSIAFLGETLQLGLLPTSATFGALRELWANGIELVRVRPAPTMPEPGLLLLTTAGVWAVAYTVEGMVFQLASPVQAVIMALTLWVTPLVVAPDTGYAWPLAVPFLAASAWLLLTYSASDLRRWGVSAGPVRLRRTGLAGGAVAAVAILLGVMLGRALPGADQDAWFDPKSLGRSENTSNPIVNLKARLVSQDTRPILRVRSPRPVYLRVTSLDVYDGQREEWTNAGVRGAEVDGPLRTDQIQTAEDIEVAITVADIASNAVLVPAVYQPSEVLGPASEVFRYDSRLATLTTDRGVTLRPGDEYTVLASVPQPTADELNAADVPTDSRLPAGIPAQVTELARRIVDEAGARTAFEQALAIQDELRTWTYSLEPAPGHSASAMLSFLQTREGYCEQFAGTMAVMLRSLGIPARVAVGYTPGTLSAAGEYVVSDQNAHAWVEVLFPGHGWIAFEPTPRSDGNVLVPNAANLAPRSTQAELGGAATNDQPDIADQPLQRGPSQPDAPVPTPRPLGTAVETGAPGPTGPPAQVILLVLALIAALGAAVASGQPRPAPSPAERALRARARVERLGRGLGAHRSPAETDREYLRRLAGAHPAGMKLAALTATACYAPSMTRAEAVAAEAAAREIREYFLRGVSVPRRAAIILRGIASQNTPRNASRLRRLLRRVV